MIRIIAAILAASVVAFATVPAQAKHYRHHATHHSRSHVKTVEHAFFSNVAINSTAESDQRYAAPSYSVSATRAYVTVKSTTSSYAEDVERIVGGRPAGCPHAFCGCGTSLHIFGRIIPELNLAANWRRFPSAPCAPGMAAWRWGHVFAIESCNGDGTAVAYDPNSGYGRTRIHTVSLRGYHIVNPQGSRVAMQ